MARPKPPGRSDLDPPPATGYPSAFDIPAFKKMRRDLLGMEALTLLQPSMRPRVRELKEQLHQIVNTVDRFYEVLGGRHWVFHGTLNTELLKPALANGDEDEAERAVIAQYADLERMRLYLMRAQAIRELRPYRDLIDAALRDYSEGRHYATVLVLLSVMDGFVNEVGEQRRGLHTRQGEELVAWNSVTAHHQGLAASQKSFTKRFNTTSAQPVHELYRNGIVHGNLTNYNNLIVSSKAWNRLFALMDWRQALDDAEKPEKPTPTLMESLVAMADAGRRRRQIDEWSPRASWVEADGIETVMKEPVAQATASMLDAWKAKNYGRLAVFLHDAAKRRSKKAFIGQVRDRFGGVHLDGYEILGVEMRGAGAGHVTVNLTAGGRTDLSELRWIFVDREGQVRHESEADAAWEIVQTDPSAIVGRRWPSQS